MYRPPHGRVGECPAGNDNSKSEAQFLGLIGTALAAAGSEDVSETPESPFAPRSLVVPGELATNFLFTSIQIGKGRDKVVSSNSIPVTSFSHKAPYIEYDWGVVRTSQNFTTGITNNSQAASTFRARVGGYAAIE